MIFQTVRKEVAQKWGAKHHSIKTPTLLLVIGIHTGHQAPKSPPLLSILDSNSSSCWNLPWPSPTFFSSLALITLWHVFCLLVYHLSLSYKSIHSTDSCLFCSLQWALNECFFSKWSPLAVVFSIWLSLFAGQSLASGMVPAGPLACLCACSVD